MCVPSGASHGILSMCLPISTVVHSSAYGSDASTTAPGIVPGRRVVGAADHQRPPHDEHGRLAEAVLLQPQRRCGVRGREQEAAERERDDRPAARDREHDHDREAQRVDDERARREALARDRRPRAPGAVSTGCAGSPRGRCRPRGRTGRSSGCWPCARARCRPPRARTSPTRRRRRGTPRAARRPRPTTSVIGSTPARVR